MKKKILIVTSLIGMFALGNVVQANVGSKEDIVSNAKREVRAAGFNKTGELVGNMEMDVQEQIAEEVNSELTANQQAIIDALEVYYNQKLQGVEETPEVKALLDELGAEAMRVINQYKAELDAEFDALLTQ